MRNNYAGPCYYCGCRVEKQQGHFERSPKGVGAQKKWRTIHAECVFKQRAEKERLKNVS